MIKPLDEKTTIQIDYPGSKEKKTMTLGQLRQWLKGEDPDYLKQFFELLEGTGSAYGRLARYTVLKDPNK